MPTAPRITVLYLFVCLFRIDKATYTLSFARSSVRPGLTNRLSHYRFVYVITAVPASHVGHPVHWPVMLFWFRYDGARGPIRSSQLRFRVLHRGGQEGLDEGKGF